MEDIFNKDYYNRIIKRLLFLNCPKKNIIQHKDIPIQMIIDYPGNIWDWNDISKTIKSTSTIILGNLDKNWNWKLLSNRKIISDNLILKTMDKDWDWQTISRSEKISMDVILKILDKDLDFDYLSDVVTMDLVFNNSNKNWNWKKICMNPKLTIKNVIDNLNCKWNYPLLSKNSHFLNGVSEIIENGTLVDVENLKILFAKIKNKLVNDYSSLYTQFKTYSIITNSFSANTTRYKQKLLLKVLLTKILSQKNIKNKKY